MISTDPKQIQELLTRGVGEVIVRDELEKKLQSGKKLRIKFGIDPTGSQIHIGHAVPLRKLKQFQDMGHHVILLIGDFTAKIGDPTGRNETRPPLSDEAIQANLKTYVEQAARVLDMSTVEVRYNSEWFANKPSSFMMELTSLITVARILERDDFQKRLKEDSDIQMQEILYPLLQGYDSVALEADVEIGGTDQKFNLLMGRKLQKKYGQIEQDVLTVPILEGTDGVRKMSKSYGNFIALNDTPEEMFGKTMSIPDDLIIRYFELATDVPMDVVQMYREQLEAGENPIVYKKNLASAIVQLYHGKEAAEKALGDFINTFSNKQRPDEIPELKPSAYDILTVLTEAGIVKSKSDAKRDIEGGGVRVNETAINDFKTEVKPGDVIQKGKRFFVKVL